MLMVQVCAAQLNKFWIQNSPSKCPFWQIFLRVGRFEGRGNLQKLREGQSAERAPKASLKVGTPKAHKNCWNSL